MDDADRDPAPYRAADDGLPAADGDATRRTSTAIFTDAFVQEEGK
jgi:hypothetical protein